VLSAGFSAACRSQAARALEAEAARVSRAIEVVRDAPNPAKAPLLEALKKEPCEHARTCELKELCVNAYSRHVDALGKSQRARTLLAAPAGGAEAALEAASVLNRAEATLDEAKRMTEACAAKQGELRRELKP
jgi:hypothetical protein